MGTSLDKLILDARLKQLTTKHVFQGSILAIEEVPPWLLYVEDMAVMKNVKMNDLLTAKRVITSLAKFNLDAWVKWLTTKHNLNAPSWLTKIYLGYRETLQ